MKQLFISILYIFFIYLSAFAQSEINCIWIKHTNNSYSCVILETNPQFIFEGESIIIDSKNYQIDDIVSYRFGNSEDASVNDIIDEDIHVIFKNDKIEIHSKGNFTDETYYIYDTNGAKIKDFKPRKSDQTAILDVMDLTPGIYFLSIKDSTFKFIKK